MLLNAIYLSIGILILWALVRASQPQPSFVIRLEQGDPRVRSGHVPASFLPVLMQIAAECGVERGAIRGYLNGKRTRLCFSKHFPPDAQQRLRNAWEVV